jgi:hypothetical protein
MPGQYSAHDNALTVIQHEFRTLSTSLSTKMTKTYQSQVKPFGNLNSPAGELRLGLGFESCGFCNNHSIYSGMVQIEIALRLMYVDDSWLPITDQILNAQIDSCVP